VIPPFAAAAASSDTDDRAAIELDALLVYARTVEREHPEHLAALGMTAEEYARSMSEPALSIDESVAAGWMSAAEGRCIQGCATLDDLLELGHSEDEARAILADQEDRARASST
jgi:heme oxygenase